VKPALLLVIVLALAVPATASAHATLLRTVPVGGSVLARAPRMVLVEFDDTVRVGSGVAAVANVSSQSVLAGAATARGHMLTIPLRANLADGDYSVRWSIVSDDGHHEQGVIAFAVGAGRPPPHAVLTARSSVGWSDAIFRTLFYLGLLGAAGGSAFGLLAWPTAGTTLRRPLAQFLFGCFLLAFLGASGIVHSASSGTRYALILKTALTMTLLGGAAAALAPLYPTLLLFAGVCALSVLAAPTLSGHALDRDQPRWLSVPTDLAHAAGAAMWLGGLACLLFVLPRTGAGERARLQVTHRFSTAAFTAVTVLAATGLLRALTELRSVSQLWTTGYGEALIVKSAIFVPLLGVGWLNRAVLIGSLHRLRRSVRVEATALVSIVVVVSVLTQLRPGKATPAPLTAPPLAAARPPTLPPRSAVVEAHELGALGVAVARTGTSVIVTLIGQDGTGVNGRDVRVDGHRTLGCGYGCYRGTNRRGPLTVDVDGRTTHFTASADAPDGTALLRAVTRAYRASRTARFDESLRSGTGNSQVTRFELVAPNRLSYRIRGGGQAVVIGARRWDRDSPQAPWIESPQSPIHVMQPEWREASNVHLVGPQTLTFLDRSVPAWFRVTLAGRKLPARVRMTAAAHFMVDRYLGYDVPVVLSPPSR
jgi:copper transport protein